MNMHLSPHKMKSCFVILFYLNIGLFLEASASFRCDYKYNSAARGWFKHFDAPVTWFDARLRCALEGAVLASPTTLDIKAEMIRFPNLNQNEETVYEVFTGIHATIAQGDYHTVEGTPLSLIPHTWAPNEHDSRNNQERCLTLNSVGNLAEVSCHQTRPFVCYRAESGLYINECGTVDHEYRLDRRTNKCYKFHKVPKVFSGAFLTCSAEGGHLAIINSDTEATVLTEIFARYPEKSLVSPTWIVMLGFTDWGGHAEWRTVLGQTLTEAGYNKFGNGQPDNWGPGGQHCGGMFRSGKLDDWTCDRAAAFICEKSPDYNAACTVPAPS